MTTNPHETPRTDRVDAFATAEPAWHDLAHHLEHAEQNARDLSMQLDMAQQAYAKAAQNAARCAQLLQEWLDTELDYQDEEYEPWMGSFTARVKEAIAATKERK